ncbi:MAG TPA: hypothetical protein VIK33_13380 [Anaerolineae bacterium]
MASGDTLNVFTPLQNEPPASIYATLDVRNLHPVLDFDGSADEEAVFTSILPRHYAGGGLTVYLHVAFSSATSGNAYWQAAFERMDDGTLDTDADSFAAFQGAAGNPNGTSGIMTLVTIPFTSGAQMDSLTVGEMFRLKVRRDADGSAGTDDVTTDAELVAVEIKET